MGLASNDAIRSNGEGEFVAWQAEYTLPAGSSGQNTPITMISERLAHLVLGLV